MNIGILGTGMVGRTLAERLVELQHTVRMGTRNPARPLAETSQPDQPPTLRDWLAAHSQVRLVAFSEAAAQSELLILAVNGSAALAALHAAAAKNMNGKVLIDVTNPLDFSHGMPPSLFVSNTDSLAEQIQAAFPQVKVVKSLNTVTAALMTHPQALAGGAHSVFVCGQDAAAKAQVIELLRAFGWQDILDLGDLSAARGLEMYLPLWLRLWGTLGTGMINIQVVR